MASTVSNGKPQGGFPRWLGASAALHTTLFGLALFAPGLFQTSAETWGSSKGGLGGVNVTVVEELPGIPLPVPAVVNDTALPNDSPSLYRNEPAAPPKPDESAIPIPARKAPDKKLPPKPAPAKSAKPDKTPPTAEVPANAVPAGQGGRPNLPYGQAATGGESQVQFGDGSFGTRFPEYVDTMTRIIYDAWETVIGNSRVTTGTRVYMRFTIAKDGKVSGIDFEKRSGIAQLDLFAQRALLNAMLRPLPPDYRGASVTVSSFYFEYGR